MGTFVEQSRNLMGRVGPADHSRVGAVTGCLPHHFENAKTVIFSQSEAIQSDSAAPVLGASGLSLRRLDPLADREYAAFLNHPAATLFHAPPWLRAVAETYGFKFWSYVATDSTGGPTGAIAYCEIDDLAGKRIVCVPFSDAWDPLVWSSGGWNQLFDALKSHGLPLRSAGIAAQKRSSETMRVDSQLSFGRASPSWACSRSRPREAGREPWTSLQPLKSWERRCVRARSSPPSSQRSFCRQPSGSGSGQAI